MSLYNYSSNLNVKNKRYSAANITNRIGDINQLDNNIINVFNKIYELDKLNNNVQKIAHTIMSGIANNVSLEILNQQLNNNIEISQAEFDSLKIFIKNKIKLVTNWSYISGNRILSGLFFARDGYNIKNDW